MKPAALIPSLPVGHLDTVSMLKYAETDERARGKRSSAIEKAFLEVRKKSFSFYIVNQQID